MNAKIWLGAGAGVALLALAVWGRANSNLYYVPSGSMEPTIRQQDRIWGDEWSYRSGNPKRDDIAIVELPLSLVSPGTGQPEEKISLIKRVVGVPGDRIEMVNGRLKLNGVWRKESFAHWSGGYTYNLKIVGGTVYSRDGAREWTSQSVIVPDQAKISHAQSGLIPPRKYLVLGDNRSNSNDSHVFGFVDRDTFRVHVTRRVWPDPRDY